MSYEIVYEIQQWTLEYEGGLKVILKTTESSGGSGGPITHASTLERDAANSHPLSAIDGAQELVDRVQALEDTPGGGDSYDYQTFSDADYTIVTTARHTTVRGVTALTANRTITLPLASSVPAGSELVINVGNLGSSVITVQRSGSDFIDMGQYTGPSFGVYDWFAGCRLISNGSNRWTSDNPDALSPRRNLLDLHDKPTARQNLGVEIGVDVQAYDSDLAAIAALSTTPFGRSLLALASAAAGRAALDVDQAGTAASLVSALAATTQPVDADLTAIAALTTTTYGRNLLTLADRAALTAATSEWTTQATYTTVTSNDWPTFTSVPTADRYRLVVTKGPTSTPASAGGTGRNLTITFDGDTTSGNYYNATSSAAAVSVAALPQGAGCVATIEATRSRFQTSVYGVIIRSQVNYTVPGGASTAVFTAHSYKATSGVPPLSSWALAASNNDSWAPGYKFTLKTASMP